MARPREISDERLLDAAALVISRLGPAFKLADVAAEARVAVGTVAQRFGSKHGLLVAMTRTAIERTRAGTPDESSPVEALVSSYAPLDDPHTAAHHLAQLAFDLADEELRALMAEFYAVMEARIAVLVQRAKDDGRLGEAPPAEVAARILTATADGTAVHWSARPRGRLTERMKADLGAIVAGWRTREEHDTGNEQRSGT
ncbi:TetR/AcrR family transcriptional regulator [Actinoallomurus sp. CA-142502]|uniref:TetR/AcrR family transcriptional regulator n=1 Tax=Actinoallomurus sp. CA-142502 TaxID=3239885 RepID=UPI003D94E2C2